jgi:hypothetical protein
MAATGMDTPFGRPVVPDVYMRTIGPWPPTAAAGGIGRLDVTRSPKSRSPGGSSMFDWLRRCTTRHGRFRFGLAAPSSLARCPESVTTTLAALPSSRIAIAGGANAVNSGTWTAPSRQIPTTVARYAALLSMSVATASPADTPSSVSPAATRSERSRSSPYESVSVVRSAWTSLKAAASGSCVSHNSSARHASGALNRATSSSTRASTSPISPPLRASDPRQVNIARQSPR